MRLLAPSELRFPITGNGTSLTLEREGERGREGGREEGGEREREGERDKLSGC